MPFTFSHPALIIPCKEKHPNWFDFTALILGSMAPDFEYFIRFKALGEIGHTLRGFIFFDLPLVFLIAFLWHRVVKKPLIFSLPKPIVKHIAHFAYEKFELKSIKSFVIFIFSALVGMGSHLLWDSFTHKDAFFVKLIPELLEYIQILNFKIPVYKILQHGSTFIGFVVILGYTYIKVKNTKNAIEDVCIKKKILYWISILTLTIAITLYRVFFTLSKVSLSYYGIYIVSFISAFIIAVICISILVKILEFFN